MKILKISPFWMKTSKIYRKALTSIESVTRAVRAFDENENLKWKIFIECSFSADLIIKLDVN